MTSEPTTMEKDAALAMGAPAGETPRYGQKVVLTYLDPEGWFLVEPVQTTAYGEKYAAALAAWEAATAPKRRKK